MQSFIKRYDVQYPMLLAGTTQPSPTSKTIAEALPQLVNFGAYPTTIYLGRDGTRPQRARRLREPGDRCRARAAEARRTARARRAVVSLKLRRRVRQRSGDFRIQISEFRLILLLAGFARTFGRFRARSCPEEADEDRGQLVGFD